MTLSAEIRAFAGRLADAGYALPIGPASDALLGAAAEIGRIAGAVMALEEYVRRTEWAAARAVGLYGGGPRLAEPAPMASATGVSVLGPVLTRVEQMLAAAGRGDGLPPMEAQASAVLLRGAAQVAAYAVRRAVEAEALEAVARDLDLIGEARTATDVVIPIEGGGGIVIPLDARRPGARVIPIDDGRST